MPISEPTIFPDMAYRATTVDEIATPDAAHIGNKSDDLTTEPTSGATGWVEGEFPPSQWFNWCAKWTGRWLRYLRERIEDMKLEGTSEALDRVVIGLTTTVMPAIYVKKFKWGGTSAYKYVHLDIQEFTGTVSGTGPELKNVYLTEAVPSGFRPSANVHCPCVIRFSYGGGLLTNIDIPGSVRIEPSGNISFLVALPLLDSGTSYTIYTDLLLATAVISVPRLVLRYGV